MEIFPDRNFPQHAFQHQENWSLWNLWEMVELVKIWLGSARYRETSNLEHICAGFWPVNGYTTFVDICWQTVCCPKTWQGGHILL